MKRILNDIKGQPGVFLPLLIICALSVFAYLSGVSVKNSCAVSKERIDEEYKAFLTMTVKEKFEYVYDEKNKRYTYTETTEKKIGSDALSAADEESGIVSKKYYTNLFSLPLNIVERTDEAEAFIKAVESGGDFSAKTRFFSEDGFNARYEADVVGCSAEELIPDALRVDPSKLEITYFDGKTFGEGAILPKALYDAYDAPESLTVGWYVTASASSTAIVATENGYAFAESYMEEHIRSLQKKPAPPMLRVPVTGYYESEDPHCAGAVVCDPDLWEKIYAAADYYSAMPVNGEYGQHYYREDVSAINEVGASRLIMELAHPYDAGKVIKELIEKGFAAEDYLVTADDYDYKFAAAQIENTAGFAETLVIASAVFALASVILTVLYSVRKRRGEIYTLRTLGKPRAGVVSGIWLEFLAVLVLGVTAGIACGAAFGNGICAMINAHTLSNAASSAERLSEISRFMTSGEAIKRQLESAAEAYLSSGAVIEYGVPPQAYAMIYAAAICASLAALIPALGFSYSSLMKRVK